MGNKFNDITGSALALAVLYEHGKMVKLDPRHIQTIETTVIKLGRIDDAEQTNKCSKLH
jgi:hypothetical protein